MIRPVAVLVACFSLIAWGEEPLSSQFGFREPEVYKLDFRLVNLLARDIDGDAKPDLIAINNLKNRLDVLAQRGSKSAPPKSETKTNDINYDQRLEHRKIQMRRAVQALEVKDVNSDGRADLIYLGDPAGLYVEYQQPDGTFGRERTFENSDAQQALWTLDIADLNADGKDDIAYLGQKYLYLIYQQADGTLSNPKRLRLGDDRPGLLKLIDIDADGDMDVVYFVNASELPVRIRLQEEDHSIGPERRLRIDPPRGVSFAEADDKPGSEILSISSLNDRFMIHTLDRSEPTDDLPTSQIVIFPFDSGGAGKQPSLVVGDFDGDKKTDVVACDSSSSQLQFFAEARRSATFPCLLGTEALRTVDVNGDGRSTLVSLSSKDKSIAISEYAEGRLSFPQSMVVEGEPLAMETVATKGETRLLYISRQTVEGKQTYGLHRIKPADVASDGKWVADSLGSEQALAMELSSKPTDMKALDANGDGREDLFVFFLAKPPSIWLANDEGSYSPAADTTKGMLGNINAVDVVSAPLSAEKPSLVVTQENFARLLTLEESGRWKVLDQYSASTGSAKVHGFVAIDLVGDAEPEAAMYDRASQSLVFLRKEDSIYRPWQSLKVGAFDLRGMLAGDFNADGKTDILLYDGEKMGIVYARSPDFVLKTLATYETDNKDGSLFDMVPSDLNGDGKIDYLLIDPMDNNLEVVTHVAGGKLERALRWQVFETKTFERESGTLEPREVVAADFDGNGLNDLAVIVHDRILLYRQDDGMPEEGKPVAEEPKSKPSGT